jgi:hypothetical protein
MSWARAFTEQRGGCSLCTACDSADIWTRVEDILTQPRLLLKIALVRGLYTIELSEEQVPLRQTIVGHLSLMQLTAQQAFGRSDDPATHVLTWRARYRRSRPYLAFCILHILRWEWPYVPVVSTSGVPLYLPNRWVLPF